MRKNLHKYRPELEKGNQVKFISKKALPYLQGKGLDIGCGRWKIKKDAIGVDVVQKPGIDLIIKNWDQLNLKYDYVFSSHCLEHISNWEDALSSWVKIIKDDGIIFLYLPNPVVYNRWSSKYRKAHKHDFTLQIIVRKLITLGIKIIDKGYNDYASMWIVGRKGLKLF